jgi:hypothetical protein
MYVRDPETVKRDARCAELRSRSWTYRQIAAELGISMSQAQDGVKRALAEIIAEPAETLRQVELEKLDRLERAALDVLSTTHHVVYQGQTTGIEDDGPRLAAVAELRRLTESRRKLLGLDQPAQIEHSGSITYAIEGVDPKDLT